MVKRRRPVALTSSMAPSFKGWAALRPECDGCNNLLTEDSAYGFYCDAKDVHLQSINILLKGKCAVFSPAPNLDSRVVPLCSLCELPAETIEVIEEKVPLVEFRCAKHHEKESNWLVFIKGQSIDPIEKIEQMIEYLQMKNKRTEDLNGQLPSVTDKINELSDTELELFNILKKGETVVKCLSNKHVGALGKLKALGLIEFDTIWKNVTEIMNRSYKTARVKKELLGELLA